MAINTVISKNRELYKTQGRRCYLCGQRIYDHYSVPQSWEPSVDHVYPKVKGFGRERNKLLAHKGCNARKGERWPRPCEVLYLNAIHEIMDWREHGRRAKFTHVRELPVVG